MPAVEHRSGGQLYLVRWAPPAAGLLLSDQSGVVIIAG